MERPPLWSVLGTIIGAPLFVDSEIVYVPYVMSGWRFEPAFFGWEWLRMAGLALLVTSAALLIDFLGRFVWQGHGTPMPFAAPRRLVVRGPYRFVRNPAYLAAVASLIGQALSFGSRAIVIYALGAWIVFHLFVVGYEEPTLRRTFGEDYEAYCHRVPRWVPRRPRSGG